MFIVTWSNITIVMYIQMSGPAGTTFLNSIISN